MTSKPLSPFEDPTSLGNLALSETHMSEEQLQQALSRQEKKQLLGEIFVAEGALTQRQLKKLLRLQKVLRAKDGVRVTKLALKRQRRKTRELVESLKSTTSIMRLFLASQKH